MDRIKMVEAANTDVVGEIIAAVAPIVTVVVQFLMIFGAATVFLPQYMTIRRTRNADGFSLYVCLALTVAGILRITFWFGHPYETPLLLQSIVMVFMMLAIIQLCTDVKSKQDLTKEKTRSFTDFEMRYFWDWTDFTSYIQCVTAMSLTCLFLMYNFNLSVIFVETVGFMSLLIEAMLAVPQFVRNRQKRSTHGMSVLTVFLMTAGDVVKTVYFVVRKAPSQFWVCGGIQLCVDFAIWYQVWAYKHATDSKRKRDSLLE